MFPFIKKNLLAIILAVISLVICWINFTPGTWLTGWDSLHPEFNFPLNLERIFNGVWRAEQGLGTVAGHSHMADLPRQLVLYPLSFIFPLSFLRYFYIFICLILGPLGIYYFLEKIIFSKNKEKSVFAFLGALFYLLNLGTVQNFYTPFEMFTTQYAVLGWLFLSISRYLQKPKKSTLIYFTLVTFLATPQAYAATLWYAFFASFCLYLLFWLIFKHFKCLKQALILLGITLVINSFWLLPNIYYIWQHSGEVLNAQINRLFSQEAFLHNYEYGNLQNTFLLKNHLFSWTYFNFRTDKFDFLLQPWISHLEQPITLLLGYFFMVIIFLGIIFSFIKKNKLLWVLIPLFLFNFAFLANATPPFSWLLDSLRRSTLIREILRFPFTKFSILLMFVYSVFFAYSLSIIFTFFKRKRLALWLLFSTFSLALIFFAWPIFQGQLISSRLRLKIPDEYNQMTNWLNQQEQGRVLQLPLHSLWGWEYRDWGFQGAGFVWFGLKQPILVRDFDRWSLANEKAYQELSYALYSQDLSLFEALLSKYDIQWLLWDQSFIAPKEDPKVLFIKETNELIAQSQKIKLAKAFGFIKIYQFKGVNNQAEYPQLINFTDPPEDLKTMALKKAASYNQINLDDYNLKAGKNYPIDLKKLNLKPELCGPSLENQIFGLNVINKDTFKLTAKDAAACTKTALEKIIKAKPNKDFLLEVSFISENKEPYFCLAKWGTSDCLLGQKENNKFYYQFSSNRELKNYEIRFILKENGESLIKDLQLKTYPTKKKLGPEVIDNLDIANHNLKYTSLDEEKRDTFYFPELVHNQSYALIIEAENISGLPLRLCITNYTSKRCDLYENLKTGQNIFFIPFSNPEGQGYDLNLSNYGIGPVTSVNLLKSVKIVPLDYEFIKEEKNPEGKYLTNNQAYEKNWRAYEYQKPFGLKSLGSPIKINGWENGWILKEETKGQIIFFFLPQLLEYFGFFLILVLIVFIAIF
jgi:hypothetical protein